MTEPEPLQQIDRTWVRFRRRKLAYFSGCDYFRLASHPRVIAALKEGLQEYGLNVSASRLTTGNHVLYRKLEAELAAFFAAEDALLELVRIYLRYGCAHVRYLLVADFNS